MQQSLAEDLSSTYRRAVATGEITKAHGIALRAVRLFEERYDLKLTSFWRRALYKTLTTREGTMKPRLRPRDQQT